MTDTRPELPRASAAFADRNAGPAAFGRGAAFRAIAVNLAVNALFPYLLFRLLEPCFPGGSVLPLLYAMVFPVAGFLAGLARKWTADAVALLALAGIAIHLAATLLAPNLGMALVLRSFQGTIIGSGFLASAAIGRPAILYLARQFLGAGAADRRARFDAVVAMDKARTFLVATTVWGSALIVMSMLHVALALRLSPDQFVLISPIIDIVANALLVVWSVRYTARRLPRYLHAPA